ncbi:PQQ-dependent sugar dehydrogenase, partial [Hyalangium sp.]|uniref:PQQ-dependent sugar dehydrogenase n=1 Tax=Hyalangium sp. TaxID=2028555 RepID=UPI002D273695
MRGILVFAATVTLVAATEAYGQERASSGQRPPVETQPPEARNQKPAAPGQTRAPQPAKQASVQTQAVAKGLERPWALEFLPDGRMLVTEKPGRMRIVDAQGRLSEPVRGLPEVFAERQGGLLDVALDPDYAKNGLIYWSYSEPREGGNGTALARGRLVTGRQPRVENVQVIFRQQPTFQSGLHFGSRLVFAPDGTLFVSLGERSLPQSRVRAQDLDSTFGKVVRIHPDGSIPKDNPLVGQKDARAEIWSYGHRNIQSAALDP